MGAVRSRMLRRLQGRTKGMRSMWTEIIVVMAFSLLFGLLLGFRGRRGNHLDLGSAVFSVVMLGCAVGESDMNVRIVSLFGSHGARSFRDGMIRIVDLGELLINTP